MPEDPFFNRFEFMLVPGFLLASALFHGGIHGGSTYTYVAAAVLIDAALWAFAPTFMVILLWKVLHVGKHR